MQAGLKCDRVPAECLILGEGPNPSRGRFSRKKACLAIGWQGDNKGISMKPTPDFNPSRLAKSLLRRNRQGALATLMAGTGDPYCSVVKVASHPDGSPILLISRLAVHTKNLLADDRVSLMLDERAEGDPLEGSRIMLSGRAEEVSDRETVRHRYLSAHPTAAGFV